jgi:hypothetical protein
MLTRSEAIALATEYAHQFPETYSHLPAFTPHEWVIKAVQAASALHNLQTDKPCADPVVEAVVKQLRDRSRLGVVKYGQVLNDNPAQMRERLQHILEEQMDSANYLQWAINELNSK